MANNTYDPVAEMRKKMGINTATSGTSQSSSRQNTVSTRNSFDPVADMRRKLAAGSDGSTTRRFREQRASSAPRTSPAEQFRQDRRSEAEGKRTEARSAYADLVSVRDSVKSQADEMLAAYNHRIEAGESREDLADYYLKILDRLDRASAYDEQVKSAYDTLKTAEQEYKDVYADYNAARDEVKASRRNLRDVESQYSGWATDDLSAQNVEAAMNDAEDVKAARERLARAREEYIKQGGNPDANIFSAGLKGTAAEVVDTFGYLQELAQPENEKRWGIFTTGHMTDQQRHHQEVLEAREKARYEAEHGAGTYVSTPGYIRTQDTAARLARESAEETASMKAGRSQLGQFGIDMGVQGVQMGADAVAGKVLPGGSLTAMALRTFGSGVREARENGANIYQQGLYGAGTAAVEVLTEKMFDGVAGIYGGGAADDLVSNWIGHLSQNKLGQAALGWAFDAAGEGFEEVVSDLVSPFLQSIYTDTSGWENFKDMDWREVGYDFLVGAAMGSVGGSISMVQEATGLSADPRSEFFMQAGQEGKSFKQAMNEWKQQKLSSGYASQTEDAAIGNMATDYLNRLQQGKRISEAKIDKLNERAANQISLEDMRNTAGAVQTRLQQFGIEDNVLAQAITAVALEREAERIGARGMGATESQREMVKDNYIASRILSEMDVENLRREQAANYLNRITGLTGANADDAQRNVSPFERSNSWVKEITGNKALAADVYGSQVSASEMIPAVEPISENNTGITYNGQTAKVVGIQDGKVRIEQAGRIQTVEADALEGMSQEYGQMVQAATQRADGNEMLRAYHSDQSPEAYMAAWNYAVDIYGAQTKATIEQARKSPLLSTLTDAQLDLALTIGRHQAARTAQATQERSDNYKEIRKQAKKTEAKKGAVTRQKGTVSYKGGTFNGETYRGVDRSKLSRSQKKNVAMIERLADVLHYDFVVYEGEPNSGGVYLSGGTILVNIHAGELSGKTLTAASLSHELTHSFKERSTAEYEQLKDFIVSHILEKSPAQFEKLVQQQMDLNATLDHEGAVDELVANACQTMLRDSKAITQLARQNMTLCEKIVDVIEDLATKIKEAFEGVDLRDDIEVYDAVRAIEDAYDEVLELWDKALTEATENDHAENVTGMKNPAPKSEVKFMAYPKDSDVSKRIKVQLQNHSHELNAMSPVFLRRGIKHKNTHDTYLEAVQEFKKIGYHVDRQGFGVIRFDPKRLNTALDYANTAAERAAILAMPRVLKRGIEIKEASEHKSRGHDTVTFAAPVELNGVRGNMAVVVKQTSDNFYKTHRILMPDGSAFELASESEDAAPTPARGATQKSPLSKPVSSASEIIVTDKSQKSKEQNQKFGIGETAEEREARRESISNLKAENRILRARAKYWRDQTRQTKERTVRQQDTDRMANDLLREYESRTNKAEIKSDLKALGDYLVQAEELDYEELHDRAEDIADRIIDGNYTLIDDSNKENLDRLKGFLKGTALNLSASDFSDTGDEGFRKRYGRYFTVRENGRSIDSAWGELAGMFGEGLFPEDAYAPGDMLRMIGDYLDLWRPQYGNIFENARGEAVEAVTNEIIDRVLSEDVRQTQATYADKAQQKLNAQIAKDKAKLDTLREQKNTRIEEIKREAAEKNRQIRLAEKAMKYEAVDKVKQHYRDMMQRQRGKRSDTALRGKIKKLHKELSDMLIRPTEKRYVPRELVKATAEILGAVDTTSGRAVKAKAALAQLKVQYDALAQDPKYSLTYDETVSSLLQTLVSNIGDSSIYDLTGGQLENVYNVMCSLRKTIQDANKLVGSEIEATAFEAGNQMMNEAINAKSVPTALLRKFVLAQATPETAFSLFGGYKKNSMWHQMYEMLNRGQLTQTQIMMEGGAIFRELIDDKQMKTLHDRKNLVDIGLKDADGNAILVTRGMMLSVYMHLQNEQNTRHIAYGGLTVPRLREYYKSKMKEAFTGKTGHAVAFFEEIQEVNRQLAEAETQEEKDALSERLAELQDETDAYIDGMRSKIEEQLTEYDRKWIAAAQEFFDVYSKGKLNEVTEMVYGFQKAQVERYFPIHTDPDYRTASFDTITRDMSLENAGFMKERVTASNPILLEDITDVISSQLRRTAQYCGLMPVIRNFNKAYGKSRTGYTMTVQKAVGETFGVEGKKYIENLIADLNGARKTEANIFDALRGNMAGAALTVNLRVTLSQTASWPTAAAEIGYRPLTKALVDMKNPMWDKGLREEIAKWTPLYWYRMQGYSTAELGDIKSNEQLMNRIMQKTKWLTGWIQFADGLTTGGLWQASKYYVDENFSDLRRGSDEYMMKVAEVYNRVIERTQPDYTTMQRPDILRNPHAVVKQLTMFMTQRLQNTNLLFSSAAEYMKYSHDLKAGINGVTVEDVSVARTRFLWAGTSQLIASGMIVLFKAAADAIMHSMNAYRDDDDELTKESVVHTLLVNFAETLTSNFLGGAELFTLLKSAATGERYYGISLNGVDTINTTLTETLNTYKKLKDKNADAEAKWKQVGKLAKAAGQFIGAPVGNLMKWVEMIMNHAEDIRNGEFGSFEAGVDRTRTQNTRLLFDALQAGDTKKAEKLKAEFKDEKDVRSALKTYIKQIYTEDKQIMKAEVVSLLQRYCGMTRKNAENTAQQWTMQVVTGMSYDKLGDEYISGNVPRNTASRYLQTYGGKTQAEAEEKLNEWQCEKDTGIAYSDIANEVKIGNISPERAVDMLVKYGGKDPDAAEKTVEGYMIEHEYGFAPSELQDEYLAGNVSDADAFDILMSYKYFGKEDAEEKAADELERLQFVRANPGTEDISVTQARNYRASGLEGFVSPENFFEAAKATAAMQGVDADGDGRIDSYSKVMQKLEYIDAMDLTAQQKTALARSLGINEKTIKRKAPWY